MTKDFIRDLFGMNNEEFSNLVENATKLVKKFEEELDVNENDNKDDDDDVSAESYFHSFLKEYDNGKLVKKNEKEFVNGECTKDEEFDATKAIDESPKDRHNCRSHRNSHVYHRLKMENETLKNQIEDMTHYIDSLNGKIKELNAENESLSQIVDNVKRCF